MTSAGKPPGGDGPERARRYFGEHPGGLQSDISSLAILLTREEDLIIPPPQRQYSWSEERVAKLIQDLWEAWKHGGAFYFIGWFTVAAAGERAWHVADGQQRLVTLTMIIAFVRDRLPHVAEFYQALIMAAGDRPRFRPRPKDQEFFRDYVQTPGRFEQLVSMEGLAVESQVRMCATAEVISTALAHLSKAELEAFAKFICRCALFGVMRAQESGGAALVLDPVHTNSMEMSYADLMKIELLTTSGLSAEDQETAARDWEEVEDDLGAELFGELIKIAPVMFSGDPILAPGDLSAFVHYLRSHSTVEAFVREWLPSHGRALRNVRRGTVGGPHAKEVNRRLSFLRQLKDQNWVPLAVSFLANHGTNHERVRRFFRGVNLIAFGALIGVIRPESRESRWRRTLAAKGDEAKLYNKKNGPLCLHEAGERDRFVQRLGATFKRDHKRDAEKRALILIQINACLPGGEALVREQGLTVEHILPVKGGEAWDRLYTPEERADYAHLIGNWTLVDRAQNAECAARPFGEKKTVFFKEGYPVYAITRMLERVPEWTKREIGLRQETFVKALFKDLDI